MTAPTANLTELTERLAIYEAGWKAMEWLAKHARSRCPDCAQYRRTVDRHRDARRFVRLRCPLAQKADADYMRVKRMQTQADEGFECELTTAELPICPGPADWVLAERRLTGWVVGQGRARGELMGYVISCHEHARLAEAGKVLAGDPGRFTIERLDAVLAEAPERMR